MRCAAPAWTAALAWVIPACAQPAPLPAEVRVAADRPAEFSARFVSNLVLVDARIDGEPVDPFLLDTGSDVSVIDRAHLGQLRLVRESSALAHGTGGTVATATVRAREFDAGPIRVTDPVFLVLDLERLRRVLGTPIGGILGLDFLEGFALTIDPASERVEVAPSGSSGAAPPGAVRLPLRRRDQLFGAELDFGDGRRVSLLVDTGMTSAVSLDAAHARRLDLGSGERRSGEFRVGIGGASRSESVRLPVVSLGPFAIGGVDVVLERPAGGFSGAIGGGLLRYFRATFDPGAGWLELSNAPGSSVRLGEENATGMRVEPRREGWRVIGVRAGTPAAEAGIRAGDVLTRIDGARPPRWGSRAVRERLGAGAPSMELVVQRGAEEFATRLAPAERPVDGPGAEAEPATPPPRPPSSR